MDNKNFFDNEKLEYISYFSEKFAHDFKNKINVILGYSSLLLEKEDDIRKKIILNNIVNSCKSFNITIKNMLTFSQDFKFKLEKININELIKENYNLITSLTKKNIELELDLDNDIFLIDADKEKIKTVIENICLNSFESINKNGKVIIKTFNVDNNNELLKKYKLDQNNYTAISIKDNGIGIPKEIKEMIFEPFFTTKLNKKSSSVGLGLPIIYGIIKKFNGFITINSENLNGTEILLLFPKANEDSVDTKSNEKNILIVDDDELVLEMVETLIQSLGFNTLTSLNSNDSIEKFKEYHKIIDCVLIDWGMPEKNGIETFIEMKKIDPNIKGILSTGYEIKKDNVFNNSGLIEILKKPYELDELENVLKKAINS